MHRAARTSSMREKEIMIATPFLKILDLQLLKKVNVKVTHFTANTDLQRNTKKDSSGNEDCYNPFTSDFNGVHENEKFSKKNTPAKLHQK